MGVWIARRANLIWIIMMAPAASHTQGYCITALLSTTARYPLLSIFAIDFQQFDIELVVMSNVDRHLNTAKLSSYFHCCNSIFQLPITCQSWQPLKQPAKFNMLLSFNYNGKHTRFDKTLKSHCYCCSFYVHRVWAKKTICAAYVKGRTAREWGREREKACVCVCACVRVRGQSVACLLCKPHLALALRSASQRCWAQFGFYNQTGESTKVHIYIYMKIKKRERDREGGR